MDDMIDKTKDYSLTAYEWFDQVFLSVNSLVQVGIICLFGFIAFGLFRYIIGYLDSKLSDNENYVRSLPYLKAILLPLLWVICVELVYVVSQKQGSPIHMFTMATSLIYVWMVLRLVKLFIQNLVILRIVQIAAWIITLLSIFGWLETVSKFLDEIKFPVGGNHVSLLGIITGVATLFGLIWLGLLCASIFERMMKNSPNVTASARVLLSKVVRIALVSWAFFFAVSSIGVDLTVFAVFGGAIGVGLGFGLQKVVSNFISGIILLLDQSIKPGDVIEVSGSYGRINKLAARYTSVVSRDGREHLIPNEDMITQPVINWTMSNNRVRRHLPVGVSYKSDVELAIKLMKEAAESTPRVLKNPKINVLLKGFGDNSIDLEVRMWIRDSQNGVSNVASEVYLKIWQSFNQQGIEFPYPQRDLHIVSAEGLKGTILDREAYVENDFDGKVEKIDELVKKSKEKTKRKIPKKDT